ncbi:MAG: cobalt ECF transporter T component CbiQ [Treponema sp.]|jgi:cobalt/nickel transport system permease protein|nr:cobalt ECF transporter T component CbiQ [Treponema sp.]
MNLETAALRLRGLETCALGGSVIHRRSAGAKLAAAAVFIVITVSFPNAKPSALSALFLYPAALLALSAVPPSVIAARLLPVLPFVLLGAAGNLYALRSPVFVWGNYTISAGMLGAVSILAKALLTVSAVLILAATTPVTRIISALGRFRVPEIFCLQLALTYRYISVLSLEASRMLAAYRLRSPGRQPEIRHAGMFLGRFLLRGFDRASRVYTAMKCRGFAAGMRRGVSAPWNAGDWVFLAACTLPPAALRFFNLAAFVGLTLRKLAA